MFWIAENPSSGSLVQCLAKNYRNDSIVSVDMDKVGVMAAYAAITPCHSSFSFQLPVSPSLPLPYVTVCHHI